VIVSLDVPDLSAAASVLKDTSGISGISGYKLGFELALSSNFHSTLGMIRKLAPDAVLIYDHQKAGNDIPEMGVKFARQLKSLDFHAAILFPFAGPETQARWTNDCMEAGLRVIVGGIMTHPKFLVSEGGYIADSAPEQIFELACNQGVRDFVVPGTKVEWVKKLKNLLERRLKPGNFDLYAPGFITQGGSISEAALAAGPRFHPIVGSGIYGKPHGQERRAAAQQAVDVLLP
jgi:orotidine-5'-phosphate decarboxylase